MNPSADALLSCRGLSCGYPRRTVLTKIDLEIRPGTSTVLLGPNGSGKSTLLKTLAKTLEPLAGEIKIAGQDVKSLGFADLARRVAYVPQEELPPFRFTVRQVVMMGRMPLSPGFFDTPADEQAVQEAMSEADCMHLESRPVTEISGGERQRALIARALAQEASLLLLDEPTSHLDVGHQVAIIRLVNRLKAHGRGMLAALHDLNLAGDLGETAILLKDGSIAVHSATEDVLASELLDEAYQVRFKRFRDETGRLRVFPEA